MTDDFRICPGDYKKENGGVVIANPNAPTSLALSRDEIEKIIAANQDAIVIVDEAYIDYGGESALSLCQNMKICLLCVRIRNHVPWQVCVSVMRWEINV